MKKSLVLLLLSFTIACSAWAEKSEYVRLKPSDTLTLESGDAAKLINATGDAMGTFWFNDGIEDMEFRTNGTPFNIVIGPGVISHTRGVLIFAIQRASDTGSTTLAWNGTEWEGSNNDGSQQANNGSSGGIDPTSIKYDELLGWAWFTDTNWVYSYTNLSWYYMHSVGGDIYVWNANLPDNGWQKLVRG